MTRVVGGRMRACRGLCGRVVIFLFASCPASFPILKYFPDHRHHIPYIANGVVPFISHRHSHVL